MAEVNILFLVWYFLVSIELKVINCFIIWHILYVDFTFKISFSLVSYGTRRWNVIFTSYDVLRGDYNVLSKNVVSQSEKTLSEVI
jgi:hypothetical protein